MSRKNRDDYGRLYIDPNTGEEHFEGEDFLPDPRIRVVSIGTWVDDIVDLASEVGAKVTELE